MTRLGVGMAVVALTAACGKSSSNALPTGPSRTLSSVAIGGPTSVSAGETAQLSATAEYSDQTSEIVTNQATWTSSNPAVATVSATGLLTALTSGTVDVSATFQSVIGRRTMQVSASRYSVRVALDGLTAIETCDAFPQGVLGEFAVQVRAVLADGSLFTMTETRGYPGNVSDPSTINLGRGETWPITTARTFTLSGAGQFVRIDFRATEWDEQIVVFPPSVRWVPDSDMNNRLGSRTHAYGGDGVGNLGPNTITLGSGGCRIRLNYTVTATRQ